MLPCHSSRIDFIVCSNTGLLLLEAVHRNKQVDPSLCTWGVYGEIEAQWQSTLPGLYWSCEMTIINTIRWHSWECSSPYPYIWKRETEIFCSSSHWVQFPLWYNGQIIFLICSSCIPANNGMWASAAENWWCSGVVSGW